MYFGSASSLMTVAEGVETEADARECRQLWRQVRTAFPKLSGTRFRVERGGGDHLLLIVDEGRAFRFPRRGGHDLDLEIAVLRTLRRHTQIAVPNYDVVDPDGRFASYLLIAGLPLTSGRFSALSDEMAKDAIAQAVTLLRSLHTLDPQAVKPSGAWPRMWSQDQFADRLQRSRLPMLARRVSMLSVPIEEFLRRYRDDSVPREVVLHGDFVGDHLLVNEHTGRLTGIIDFSDVALGDPAHDFLGFWSYGANVAAHAVGVYGHVDADPTLLARSRNHFIRYQIDRLFEMMADGASDDVIRTHSARLAVLL